jgi:hypothetical protein
MAMACSPEEQKRLMVTAGTVSGAQRGDAGDVVAALPFRRGTAEDDVLHHVRRHGRIATEQTADGDGRQVVRAHRAQRTARRLADRRAHAIDDDCFLHNVSLIP